MKKIREFKKFLKILKKLPNGPDSGLANADRLVKRIQL
jgi:hypothetical protein